MQFSRRHAMEVGTTRILLAFTLFTSVMFLRDIALGVQALFSIRSLIEGIAFVGIAGFLIYGNIGYQLTRLAHWQRLKRHRPAPREALDTVYEQRAPTLQVLVPSYKEELRTVRHTLMSAALQDYPGRRVTLLIDDPCHTTDPAALEAVAQTRQLVTDLQARFEHAAAPFVAAQQAFAARCRRGAQWSWMDEARHLAALYTSAAQWLMSLADEEASADHTDVFFRDAILLAPAQALQERAAHWREAASGPQGECATGGIDGARRSALAREYGRLAALFKVDISSFERKRFENLSHEPNKAMNLNTYIGLIGGRYGEVRRKGGIFLEAAPAGHADLDVPPADFLITLDADSLLLPGYALRLLHLMCSPGNERVAVAQTPYSAIPDPTGALERVAGATTDIQYLVHQGFTAHKATFWVGANAVLRMQALREIATHDVERGHPIQRFIQDRTVIEDTESTVDLLCRNWTLHNYPERLAYSATPPDFGALAVQRERWANGGLIILPKLLRYLVKQPSWARSAREGFFRVHYLTSIAGVNVGLVLMLAYPFPDAFQSPWLPATALPYYLLFARDLWLSGYRSRLDIVRVYALNLLLLPVNLGGVLRSLHQAAKGHKIPFRRTPKVAGRTRVDPGYVLAEFVIAAGCIALGMAYAHAHHWGQAVFALVNGGFFIYGIHTFLGWQNALSDLRSGWDERVVPILRVLLSRTAAQ